MVNQGQRDACNSVCCVGVLVTHRVFTDRPHVVEAAGLLWLKTPQRNNRTVSNPRGKTEQVPKQRSSVRAMSAVHLQNKNQGKAGPM